MSKAIESIENNPFKNKIRQALMNQAKEWGHNPVAVMLPAENWLTEKMMAQMFPKAIVKGFEADFERYIISRGNMPKNPNFSIEHGFLGEIEDKSVNFAWFDYCGAPYGGEKFGLSRIEDPARFIRQKYDNKQNAMVYVTYCMISRTSTVEEMINKIWGGLTLKGAIKRKLWSEIGIEKGNGIHLVFEVEYLGGENQKTPMYTLGFQIGEKTVETIVEDWASPVKQDRNIKYDNTYIPPQEIARIQKIASKTKADWDSKVLKLKQMENEMNELANQLKDNPISMDDRDLIRFAHAENISNAGIHELTKLLPKGRATIYTYIDSESRNLSRRNVGATLAWA